MPPDEIARLGIAQVPGGAGVFPTSDGGREPPRRHLAGSRRSSDDPSAHRQLGNGHRDPAIVAALAPFPALARRLQDRAGDLSGGQQQMLALAMSLLSRPRLLLIDELSLGLAPLVVEALLASITQLARDGDRRAPSRAVHQCGRLGGHAGLHHGPGLGAPLRIGRRDPGASRAAVVDLLGRATPRSIRARPPGRASWPTGADDGQGSAAASGRSGISRVSFGGIRALDEVILRGGAGRDRRDHRSERRREDHACSTRSRVSPGPPTGRSRSGGTDVTDWSACRRARARPRAVVPRLPTVLRLVGGRHRWRWRSSASSMSATP